MFSHRWSYNEIAVILSVVELYCTVQYMHIQSWFLISSTYFVLIYSVNKIKIFYKVCISQKLYWLSVVIIKFARIVLYNNNKSLVDCVQFSTLSMVYNIITINTCTQNMNSFRVLIYSYILPHSITQSCQISIIHEWTLTCQRYCTVDSKNTSKRAWVYFRCFVSHLIYHNL